jgi:hypothetical protein
MMSSLARPVFGTGDGAAGCRSTNVPDSVLSVRRAQVIYFLFCWQCRRNAGCARAVSVLPAFGRLRRSSVLAATADATGEKAKAAGRLPPLR